MIQTILSFDRELRSLSGRIFKLCAFLACMQVVYKLGVSRGIHKLAQAEWVVCEFETLNRG